MLGHRLLRQLAPSHEARVTLRRRLPDYARYGLFDRDNAFDSTDVRDFDRVPGLVVRQPAWPQCRNSRLSPAKRSAT